SGPNIDIYSNTVFERYCRLIYANSWYIKKVQNEDDSLGQMEFSIKTFWRPVKNSPLTFEALNLFSEQLIETGYKIKSENEKRALSLLEEKYKVISVNSICWLVKDVYKFSNLKYRIYQAVLNDQTALNIEFTRWTNPPFGSSELGECDMIENWNQAEKAFM
ncbi:hypothetical protein, partial [Aliikangiella maris]